MGVTMNPSDRIYVAGHNGLVGSALVRALHARGFTKLILRSRAELDLCRQAAVETFFAAEKPDVVLFAAAKVGGIVANNTWRYAPGGRPMFLPAFRRSPAPRSGRAPRTARDP